MNPSANPRTLLLRLDDQLGARLAKAAASRGVTRQAIIAGVLDATLPPADAGHTMTAWRQLDIPGFPAELRTPKPRGSAARKQAS